MARLKPINIIGKIYENVRKKKWSCFHLNCEKTAINSHLGQQNGILNELQEDGHLIQVKVSNAHHWNKKRPIAFKKLGIGKSISLPIFCKSHDSELFKSIESGKSNLMSYTSFLLFSYRTICAEIRKKEIGIEQYRRVFESNSLEGRIDKIGIQSYKHGLELGIRDLNILKKKILDEFMNSKHSFQYWALDLPKYEIFVTTVMSVFPIGYKDANDYELENLYIHLIPRANNTLLLIGYHKDYFTEEMKNYCLSWSNLSKIDTDFKITNLITNHVENWVMSPVMYNQLTVKQRNKYIDLLIRDINHYGIPNSKEFNLFEGITFHNNA